MRSISVYIDPATIFAQIRMERQIHRGGFLLVEGSTDAKRIDKFIDKIGCSVVNCYGKPNVLDAIEMMQDVGLEDCLGLVDSDFDRINRMRGNPVDQDGVITSEFHDLDMDNAFTDVIDRYLMEVAEQSKLEANGGIRLCIDQILMAIKPLSILRYANELRSLRYNLQRIDLDGFFDGETVNVDGMIDAVSTGSFSSSTHRATLRTHIDELMSLDFDLMQLTNGHDFLAALGIALRECIGRRKVPQTWRSEVEMHLRFGLSRDDFSSTHAYREIKAWEASSGHSILRH